MFRLFNALGFAFSWLAPFGVIWINHIVLEDASWDVDMFGLLMVLALGIGLLKYIDKECEVWKIQNRYKLFRLNWANGKKIVIAFGFVWLLYTIKDDIDKMQLTALLIAICFTLGWLFSLLGSLKKNYLISFQD